MPIVVVIAIVFISSLQSVPNNSQASCINSNSLVIDCSFKQSINVVKVSIDYLPY